MNFRNILKVLAHLAGIVLVLSALLNLRRGGAQDVFMFVGGGVLLYLFYSLDGCLTDCVREVEDQNGNGL